MEISLYIERRKKESIIEERFHISPKKSILLEEERSVYWFLNLVCIRLSLPLPLLSIKRYPFLRIHTYQYQEDFLNTNASQIIKYKYIPFVGKKTCSKCIYYKKINKKRFCTGRLKTLTNDTWQNCLYWTENSVIQTVGYNDKNINI